jgi:hypothetical protein
MHSLTVMIFQRQVTVLNGSGQIDHRSEFSGLGPKISETWRGLIMDSTDNMLSSSMPTHTHNFDNHNNGYGRSKTALVWSLADRWKLVSLTVWNSETVSESERITVFKIAIFLIRLGNLMICTHDLITLTKAKEMTRYCGSNTFGGKVGLNTVSIELMQVSVPIENRSNSHQPSHMPLRVQHPHAHSCP